MKNWQEYWWPLATETEVSRKQPLSRTLFEIPLVIFRDEKQQIGVLQDRCPHRQAPLSAGRICNGKLECPYHGWRFTRIGECAEIPGMTKPAENRAVLQSYNCQIRHGLIWVCLSPTNKTPEPAAPNVTTNTDSFFMSDIVNCSVQQAAENFLDGFHTHFVHAGWIRHDKKRQPVTVRVRSITDGVEAQYTEKERQSGIISRLLEGERTSSAGRFRLPGVAEIEYQGRHGLNLLVTVWLVPENAQKIRFYARVATRKGLLPAWLKHSVLRPLFGIILRQDKAILEKTTENIARFSIDHRETQELDGPLDFLAPYIRLLLEGKTLSVEEKEFHCKL